VKPSGAALLAVMALAALVVAGCETADDSEMSPSPSPTAAPTAGPPRTPTTDIYISGQVVISDTVKTRQEEYVPPEPGHVAWIVDVTATNRNSEQPFTSDSLCWRLETDGEATCSPETMRGFPSPSLDLEIGETGETRLLFAVPATAGEQDTRLCCERPPETYSFCDLAILERTHVAYLSGGGELIYEDPIRIAGYLTIADEIDAGYWTYEPEDVEEACWVVDISVENMCLDGQVTSNALLWCIEIGDEVYWPTAGYGIVPPVMNVPPDDCGDTRMLFVMPRESRIEDASLGYGPVDEPVFWGSLSGGETVATLEWTK
jgi:hypothetical protein